MSKLIFRYGAMGSSKTANALMVRYNYYERDKKVVLLKPRCEDRDGAKVIKSRMHDWYEALPAATREHVFTWEVNAFLHYIKENQTYDDSDAISGLAKCVSMLAIEDWKVDL